MTNTITIDPSDPVSLALGLQHMNGNLVDLGQAITTLTSILGVTIAMTDRADNTKATLTDALLLALDHAHECGLGGPIVKDLRAALKAGAGFTPPPDRGTHLRIVRSGEDERKAAESNDTKHLV